MGDIFKRGDFHVWAGSLNTRATSRLDAQAVPSWTTRSGMTFSGLVFQAMAQASNTVPVAKSP